jgi:hypothetical protein
LDRQTRPTAYRDSTTNDPNPAHSSVRRTLAVLSGAFSDYDAELTSSRRSALPVQPD